jgi:endonuclease/exonuclease/phosphatase family metal-dependent hydrolase
MPGFINSVGSVRASALLTTFFAVACGLLFDAHVEAAVALPGTVQVENFESYYDTTAGNYGGHYRSTNVDIASCSEGGYYVGWTSPGESLAFTVNVAAAGNYTLEARVASYGTGGTFHVEFGGVNKTGAMSIPNTGGWQTWQTIRKTVTLSAGQQVMKVRFDSGSANGSGNINYVRLVSGSTTASATPFGGTPWALPGTVQAENFDNGGLGVAYGDNTKGNTGGAYRATDVDIERSSEGSYDIGWVSPGEWVNYTVKVATAGTYAVKIRVASAGSGGSFWLEFGGANKTGTLWVPNTGGWQAWQTVTKVVTLSAGVQSMRLVFGSRGSNGAVGNFNYVRVESGSTSTTSTVTSTGSQFRIMTWNVQQGKRKNGVYDPTAQAQFMANSGAQIIALQEVSTWGENLGTKYKSLLQQYTGATWYSLWIPGTGCLTGGCLGQQILSRFPIAGTALTYLVSSGAGRVLIYINGVPINIFTNHLDYNSTSTRTTQLGQLMTWARSFSAPRLVLGDFNSWWGEYWIKEMEKEYSDTWQDTTGSDQNGYTVGNVRFDYIFRSRVSASRLTPVKCWVPWTDLSDHKPVVADFRVQ